MSEKKMIYKRTKKDIGFCRPLENIQTCQFYLGWTKGSFNSTKNVFFFFLIKTFQICILQKSSRHSILFLKIKSISWSLPGYNLTTFLYPTTKSVSIQFFFLLMRCKERINRRHFRLVKFSRTFLSLINSFVDQFSRKFISHGKELSRKNL